MSQTRSVVLVALQCAAAACSSPDTEVTQQIDTTGLEYQVVCDEDGCEPEPLGEMDCGDGLVLLGGPTYLLVCASEGSGIFNENCRAVVCTTDDGCRESFDVEYVCRNQMCQRSEPLDEITRGEAFARCLHDVPRSEVCRESAFVEPQHELVQTVRAACPIDPDNLSNTCGELPETCTGGAE